MSILYVNKAVFILRFFFHLLFLNKGEGREKARERNTYVRKKHWLAAFHTFPDWGLIPQPRHVPWWGIEPMAFHFLGWHPTNWPTPVMPIHLFYKNVNHSNNWGKSFYLPGVSIWSMGIQFWCSLSVEVFQRCVASSHGSSRTRIAVAVCIWP